MPTIPPPVNVVSYVLNVDGTSLVTYPELVEISSAVEPEAVDPAAPAGVTLHTKQFGTIIPPTVTLRRGLDANHAIWTWHMAVLAGDPAARKNCTLQLMGSTGQVLMSFILQNAWPGTVQIAGPQPQHAQVTTQTDTFICDQIQLQPA